MEEIDLSVIIVCYQSDDFIFDAVRSVIKYDDLEGGRTEIILVDNSPAEYARQSFAKLRHEFGDRIILIHNARNGGYGQGNNLGIAHSKGKMICIMNPDVNLVRPIFRHIRERFRRSPQLALIGGKQYGHKNISFYFKPEYEFLLFTGVLTMLCNRLNFYHPKYMFLSGAFLFMDKAKFEAAGNFDENIFLYCEEADISHRIQAAGYTTLYDRSIEYNHLIDGRTELSAHGFKVLLESNRYYFLKFKLNFRRFLHQKVWSYHLMGIIFYMLNKKDKAATAKENREQYLDWLKFETSGKTGL